jgi:hypothetical protein
MFKAYAIIYDDKLCADLDYRPYIMPYDKEGLECVEQVLMELRLAYPDKQFKLLVIGEAYDA